MKMKRLLLSIVSLLLSVLIAVGCQPFSTPSNTDTDGDIGADTQAGTDETTSTVPDDVTYLDVVKNGAVIEIVYSLDADAETLSTVQSLVNYIYRLCDVRPKSVDDWLKAGESHDSEKIEILFGKTNYEESETAYAELPYGSGVCRVIGNKIVLAGTDTKALEEAIVALITELKANQSGKDVKIPKDFYRVCKSNEQLAAVPMVEGCSAPTTVDCGDSCYQLVFTDATAEIYGSYLAKLEQSGYTLYTQNEIDKNRFATYVSDSNILNLALINEQKLTITTESFATTALQGLVSDNVYADAGVETTLTQIGLYYNGTTDGNGYATGNINGMSYVYRLADGSFLVIDGGHGNEACADRLYQFLRKQASDPESIVVAAWIFTHDHDDHVGFFSSFARKYHQEVAVERFLFNFPSSSQLTSSAGTGIGGQVKGSIKSYYPNAVRHKVHSGQIYYVRNATVRILFGLESMQPHNLTYYNNTSIVFQVEAEGVKTLFLGDCGEDESRGLTSTYSASTLKSDILQVAHHGINGCDSSLYDRVAASYAFLPIGADKVIVDSSKINSILGMSINKYVKNLSKIPNRVFMAKDDVVVFTLSDGKVASIATFEDVAAFVQ